MTADGSGAVGMRMPRPTARAKVRGELVHVGDVPVGRCLHAAVHRSTRPHATIAGVDTGAARSLPGVVAVVTGADLRRELGDRMFTGPAFADQPVLAVDKVRYIGEPVAAVLAGDAATARAAADLVDVEYVELAPVPDVPAALAGESFVHEALRPSMVFGDLRHLSGRTGTNVNYEYRLRGGDPAGASAPAVTRATARFWCPPTHHVPIELFCTFASPAGDRLEMLTTTQTPSYVRQTLADLLDLPLSRVRVRTAPLGGSFGAKMYDRLEPLVGALAWTQRTPVRMVTTREESFLLTTRHGAAVAATMAAGPDGAITAARMDVVYDTGAYADVGPRIAAKSGMVAAGPYRIGDVEIRSRCVYTNKPSAGPLRGFGVPQVTFAHESMVDELARLRNEDPVEFRRRNLLREGDESAMGTRMHSADFVGCLDAVAGAIGWERPLAAGTGRWRAGRGVAVGVKAVLTPTVANAVLQLNQDASATLLVSTVDMGQGSDTILAQLAGQVLHLEPARVRVVCADTDVTPYDTITAGSRSTYHTGNAVRRAAEAMRERLLEICAGQLGVATAELKLTAAGVAGAQRVVSIPDLLHGHFGARGTTLTTEGSFVTEWTPYDPATGTSQRVTEHWFAGAVGVTLRVDTHTGRVRVDHLAVAGDVGRAINPTLVEQQLRGAALMGLGHALFDELVFDEGQLVNGTLLDYQIPSLRDVPATVTPVIVESPHRAGPFGAKGVGETGTIPVAPAVANGVRDAVGVRITTLPLTPERVLDELVRAGVS
jgi:CO/xanthine dehydrogenase Mo-binding subunit